MHKKDKVKEVIDKYINKGMDFFELTPSYLVTLDELKGYSERTLKRGRTEYKAEHKNTLKGKSKAALNFKKKILMFLNDNPSTTQEQVKKKFASQDKKVVLEALKEWRQQKKKPVAKKAKTSSAKDDTGSLRQQVFNHLDDNPRQTLSKLEKAFPKFNKKTISNYLDQWRKEKSQKIKKVSTKQRIYDYLNQYPESTLKDLKSSFSDINPSSIGAYHSQWKSDRSTSVPASQKGKAAAKSKLFKQVISGKNLTVESAQQIIEALNSTIDAQNKTIEILKSQNSILEDTKAFAFPELKGMSQKDIDKFERVMATFLRGLRKS